MTSPLFRTASLAMAFATVLALGACASTRDDGLDAPADATEPVPVENAAPPPPLDPSEPPPADATPPTEATPPVPPTGSTGTP